MCLIFHDSWLFMSCCCFAKWTTNSITDLERKVAQSFSLQLDHESRLVFLQEDGLLPLHSFNNYLLTQAQSRMSYRHSKIIMGCQYDLNRQRRHFHQFILAEELWWWRWGIGASTETTHYLIWVRLALSSTWHSIFAARILGICKW